MYQSEDLLGGKMCDGIAITMVKCKSPGVKWQTTCRASAARSGKRDAPPMACRMCNDTTVLCAHHPQPCEGSRPPWRIRLCWMNRKVSSKKPASPLSPMACQTTALTRLVQRVPLREGDADIPYSCRMILPPQMAP
jgi:hypothetical protein